MKKITILLATFFAFASCDQKAGNSTPDTSALYAKNLATAQKFFELFKTEDMEAQKPLICPGITHYPPFHGASPVKYDGFIANTKAWMDNFDDITYEANVWLPGTDSLGVLNGSVRTYGVWTAKNTMTGNVIKTNAYHSFDFNGKGQIHIAQDYFDASGVMAAAMKKAE